MNRRWLQQPFPVAHRQVRPRPRLCVSKFNSSRNDPEHAEGRGWREREARRETESERQSYGTGGAARSRFNKPNSLPFVNLSYVPPE